MGQQSLIDEFDELACDKTITVEDLDRQVVIMVTYKQGYDELKARSNHGHELYQEAKAVLITMLKAANKKKYHVDGVGTVAVTEKLKVTTPKSLEDKQALFEYLKRELGNEGFLASASVNYNTLNRIYNEAFDKAKEDGNAAEFSIPGIEQPQAEFGLSFRK